ncbi:uncharacterized protein DS421_16g538250 [Arachis hypogaea]|nr:uncharacterized protein DS421_16g538250 [Arachis hypogaea]
MGPKPNVLCIILLAWNAICYSFPFLLFLLLCCIVPLISSLLGYNMNMGSNAKGASDDQISQIPSWRYKQVHDYHALDHYNHDDCSQTFINEDQVRNNEFINLPLLYIYIKRNMLQCNYLFSVFHSIE